jgi:tetraacyldisaccharide 4'-kinase
MRSFRVLWKAVVEGQAGPLTRWVLGPPLRTLTYPYNWGHQIRLQAYHRGWATVRQLPCHVISVGNITLGGTGKTPVVEAIARLLRQQGLRVGVLSRGYGGKPQEAITIVSDGEKCLVPPDVAGDEPLLLAEHLAGVPVVVANDRYAAGMLAVERFGVEVIILDDGFQHLQLARDLDILLLDAARPFGNGRLFPSGNLRERPTALARADVIVMTHWEPDTALSIAALKLPQPAPPLFHSQDELLDLRVLDDGRILPLTSIKGQHVLAFCGLGTPEHFRRTLQRLEAEVSGFAAFPDHHPYSRSEIDHLVQMAIQRRTQILLTTEKDGVRLRRLRPLPGQVWELRIRATIVEQEASWKACILRAIKG